MKAITNLVRGMMIVMVSLLIFSCSDGEDGAIGPAGQDGIDGVDGTNGTDGNDGVDGNDGNDGNDGADGTDGNDGSPGTANVIYSNWFNTELSDNIAGSSDTFTINAPEIDADILNFGTVLVYARRIVISPGPTINISVYQLPITFGAARQQSYLFSLTNTNQIRISVQTNEEGDPAGDGTFLEQYRYVIIPGGISTSSSATSEGLESGSKSREEYKNMSYEEIRTLFNIPE